MTGVNQRILVFVSMVGLVAAALAQRASAAQPPFSIVISTPRDTVKAGSNVDVEVTVTNTSDHDIKYRRLNWPHVKQDVRDSKGRPAPETPYGRELHAGHVGPTRNPLRGALEPGKTNRVRYPLTMIYDLSQPGTYTVQEEQEDPETKTFVKSNTITVTVTP